MIQKSNTEVSQFQNKKIVELEKNQRPMIDQNRKLNERNKNLTSEVVYIQ